MLLDNIKVWRHVVSEDYSWEYNGGAGREDALHEIYGPANDYKPGDVDVGYHYYYHAVRLAAAVDINQGYGLFNNNPRTLTDTRARPLADGDQFAYGSALDSGGYDIFDTNDYGPYDTGKLIRLVENGKNVTDASGLNLTPMARDLTTVVAPPGDTVYIDPVNRSFILPRPNYFSKLEDAAGIASPSVKDDDITPAYSESGTGSVASLGGHFGDAMGVSLSTAGIHDFYIYPLGNASGTIPNKGTWSSWVTLMPTGSSSATAFLLSDSSDFQVRYISNGSIQLWVGGSMVDFTSTGEITVGVPVHIYVVWDDTGGLADSKTARVFVNGSEILSTTNAIPDVSGVTFLYRQESTCVGGDNIVASIDNLKVWKHVASEDPAWEYNGGTGREEALHYIYGSANDYRPLLTGGVSGVGYHYYEP
jgi:hypothetical protein